MKHAVLALTVLALLIGGGQQAKADLMFTSQNVSTTGATVDVNAQADFSLNSGTLTVTLTNSLQNPTNFEQLISGLLFNVSGSTMPPSLTTATGNLGTLMAGPSNSPTNGTYTTMTNGSLTNWTVSALNTTPNIDLTTDVSYKFPNQLILGPDNGSGKYSIATETTIHNNPYVLGSAIFDLTIPGLKSLNQLSDVEFQFGTTKSGIILVDGNLVPAVDPVPEPTGMSLMVVGILCLGVVVGLRRHPHGMSAAA